METEAEKISKQKKREEAIARMKLLKVSPSIINTFRDKGRITVARDARSKLDSSKYEPNLRKEIDALEKEYHLLVYLVARSETEYGLMDNLFYVSDERQEWQSDREGIKDKRPFVYVVNHDMPWCSEFGSISIALDFFGTPYRVWRR